MASALSATVNDHTRDGHFARLDLATRRSPNRPNFEEKMSIYQLSARSVEKAKNDTKHESRGKVHRLLVLLLIVSRRNSKRNGFPFIVTMV